MAARHWRPGAGPLRGLGFSLIELLIVVTMVAILASVAVPGYMQYTADARRGDGRQALLNAAQLLERCYTAHGRYDADDCNLIDGGSLDGNVASQENYYVISEAASTINANTFTLVAVPQNQQAGDECGNLTLDQTGARGASTGTVGQCW